MNMWINMQQTFSLCYPARAAWADRVFRKTGYFRDFRSSIFSVLQQIITYLCECMCECVAFGAFACLHTSVCTLSLPFPCVTICICGRACECVLFSLCMFHTQHCLLETLSKSPQCDNWLPGVPVSLPLIIVIPCRKKKQKRDRQSSLVCRVNWSQVWFNSFCEVKLWGYVTAGQSWHSLAAGCYLLPAIS